MSFTICEGKGVHITFENGCSISIQWGPGNYCERGGERKHDWVDVPKTDMAWKSKDAEVAVMDAAGAFFRVANCDDVAGWNSPDKVAMIIIWAAMLPVGSTRKNTIVPKWVSGFTGGLEDIDPEPKEENEDGA